MCDSLSDSVESRQLPFVSILMSCAAMAEAICEQQKTHPNACLLSSEFNQSILAEKKWLSKSQNVTQITYQYILQNMLWNSNHGLCSNCILNLRKDNNSKISSFPMTDKTLLYILYPNFFLYSDFLYFIHSLFFDPSFHVFVSFCCLPVFFHMVLCISFFFFFIADSKKIGCVSLKFVCVTLFKSESQILKEKFKNLLPVQKKSSPVTLHGDIHLGTSVPFSRLMSEWINLSLLFFSWSGYFSK